MKLHWIKTSVIEDADGIPESVDVWREEYDVVPGKWYAVPAAPIRQDDTDDQ